MADWKLTYRPSLELPPLAWVARVRFPEVEVVCGTSVRHADDAFFDGTWVGPPELSAVAGSTTPFGSGIVVDGNRLLIVPPAHALEGVYVWRSAPDYLLVANTLCGLLEAADLQLLPDIDYVSRFIRVADGLGASPIEIPTTDRPVEFHFYENLLVAPDGTLSVLPKPREAPFTSFEDYFARIDSALASLVANGPGYEPVVTLSNGYDSTAMAVLAARHGCRRALTFAVARPAISKPSDTQDSGAATAERLGMRAEVFDRLAYLRRDDLPEAEFLATGMSGEDVANAVLGPALRKKALITGDVGAAVWRHGRNPTRDLRRIDISGCSMTEFRLQSDFLFLPLAVFGISETPSLQEITQSIEMRPWSVGGYYDRPIPRRIAEEAGLPRGSFAVVKHAATALIHQQGAAALAPATFESVKRFAAAEGSTLRLTARPRLRRRERFVIKAAHTLRGDGLARGLRIRQHSLIHHEPESGSILFRWAVEQLRPRYAAVRELLEI